MNENPAAGIIGIGIVLLGVLISFLFFRKKIEGKFKRSLITWLVGIPLGVALLFLVQIIINLITTGNIEGI